MKTQHLLGAMIKQYREAAGKTKTSLARKLEVSLSAIYQVESGKNRLDAKHLAAVAAYLDIPIGALKLAHGLCRPVQLQVAGHSARFRWAVAFVEAVTGDCFCLDDQQAVLAVVDAGKVP